MRHRALATMVLVITCAATSMAADITGRWTAAFDTQIGRQEYKYEFQVKGETVTGTASSANGESPIRNGKVNGNTLTFLENFVYQGMTIPITYTGTIVSEDEIAFTRQVGEFATEELVAKRVK